MLASVHGQESEEGVLIGLKTEILIREIGCPNRAHRLSLLNRGTSAFILSQNDRLLKPHPVDV